MKDYREIAQDVLQRGAQEIERNKKRRRMFLCWGTTAAVAGLAAVVGIGVWYGKPPRQDAAGQFAALDQMENSGKNNIGRKDTVDVLDVEDGASQGVAEPDYKVQGDLSGMDGGAGDFSDLDGGMEGFSDLDGDPAGYSSGMGGDSSGYDPALDGAPSGNDPTLDSTQSDHDPVPGGNPSGYDVAPGGEMQGELDPESKEGNFGWYNIPAQMEETKQPGEMDTADINGTFVGGVPDGGVETTQPMEMISSYPEDAIYCYAAPGNGEVFCSAPLTHAMEEYGDTVRYRVLVELFHDGNEIDAADGEAKLAMEHAIELGYTVAWEKYDDGEEVKCYYMLHATKEQLTGFDAGEEYGYILRFFDEP